jgi:hypothetical protein
VDATKAEAKRRTEMRISISEVQRDQKKAVPREELTRQSGASDTEISPHSYRHVVISITSNVKARGRQLPGFSMLQSFSIA